MLMQFLKTLLRREMKMGLTNFLEEFIIRKPAKTPGSSAKVDEVSLGNLDDDDDSFFNSPVSSKKVGKNIVINFERRSGRHAAPPVRPLRNNSSNNNTVTKYKGPVSSTHKNYKTKRLGPELTNAPMKRTSKKTKAKPAAEENLESDDGQKDEK